MQGFEKIKAQIALDANSEKDRIIAKATAQAEELSRGYAQKAKAAEAEALQKGTAEIAAAKARSSHTSEGTVKLALLTKKRSLIDRAFVAAKKELLALQPDDMLLVLLGLGKGLNEKSGEILMNPADRDKLGSQLAKQLSKNIGGDFKPAKDTVNISGGFILRCNDIEINCSFDRLLDRAHTELSGEVAGILFEG